MQMFLFIFSLLFSPSAFSGIGEWGSTGGGEFLKDQHNPWFLKNTKEVRFCLSFDVAGFSATPEKAAQLTDRALEYWKKELSDRGELLGLGQQNFSRLPTCDGNEDLRLQFGYGTLSEKQLKLFKDHEEDPQDYVGIAIRTEYDRARMRGKGFIYISSDRGTHPYNRGHGLAKNLWSHDGLLFQILLHELGHVFGVPHTDDGFMAASFPESLVRKYREYRTLEAPPFFEPSTHFEKCAIDAPGLPNNLCINLTTKNNWDAFDLTITNESGPEIWRAKNAKRESVKLLFPIKVFLPKEQMVFTPPPQDPWLQGPSRKRLKVIGALENSKGEKRSTLVDLRPDGVEIFLDAGAGLERIF